MKTSVIQTLLVLFLLHFNSAAPSENEMMDIPQSQLNGYALPGRNKLLKLDDIEVLTGKTFRELISRCTLQNPYLLAEVLHFDVGSHSGTNSNNYNTSITYVDAQALHKKIEKIEGCNFINLAGCVRPRKDDVRVGLLVRFSKKNDTYCNSKRIIEIHYFEFNGQGFEYIGSLSEIMNNSKTDIKEKLLTKFINKMTDSEISQELISFHNRFEENSFNLYFEEDASDKKRRHLYKEILSVLPNDQSGNTSTHDSNAYRMTVLLEEAIRRLEKNINYYPEASIARFYLANLYILNHAPKDLIKATIDNIDINLLSEKFLKLSLSIKDLKDKIESDNIPYSEVESDSEDINMIKELQNEFKKACQDEKESDSTSSEDEEEKED